MNARAEVQEAGAAGEVRRLAAIARVAAAKGWEHYAARLGFGGQQHDDTAPHGSDDAAKLREAL